MTVEWFGDQVLEKTNRAMAIAEKEIAEDVMKDAKAKLRRDAKTTTDKGLLSQFYVDKSKFKDGGYLVWCQGPKNWHKPYHASFVEIGNVWIHPYGNKAAPKINLPAIPFMRPAAKKNKRSAKRKFQEALDSL